VPQVGSLPPDERAATEAAPLAASQQTQVAEQLVALERKMSAEPQSTEARPLVAEPQQGRTLEKLSLSRQAALLLWLERADA